MNRIKVYRRLVVKKKFSLLCLYFSEIVVRVVFCVYSCRCALQSVSACERQAHCFLQFRKRKAGDKNVGCLLQGIIILVDLRKANPQGETNQNLYQNTFHVIWSVTKLSSSDQTNGFFGQIDAAPLLSICEVFMSS